MIYTGKGIGVCILDTGIFEHIDFAGRIWAFYDFLSFKRLPYDDNGHGTHVAGLAGGDGTASMGKYRGAAPGCEWKPGRRFVCFSLDKRASSAIQDKNNKYFGRDYLQSAKRPCKASGKCGTAVG